VVGHCLVGHPSDIAPESSGLGFAQENIGFHRDLAVPVLTIGGGGSQNQVSVMRFHLCIDTLVGTADDGVTRLEIGIDAPVASGPIGMFTQQADASWYKEIHGWLLDQRIMGVILSHKRKEAKFCPCKVRKNWMGTLALQSINALYTNHGYLLMAVLLLLLIPPILVFFFALKNLSRAWLSLGSKASEVL
jgi:hypothetical protein